jgi:predicted phage tail protein
MRSLRVILAVVLLLGFTLYPVPAHASSKAGGIALVVAGSLLVAGGAFLYAVRYNAEETASAAPAFIVGGVGVASIVTGAIVLSNVEPEPKKASLRLVPMHHGIALACVF